MYRTFFIFTLITCLLLTGFSPVIAQTDDEETTEASKEAETNEKNAVEQLKEKVESKVSELKNNSLRTRAGFITAVSDTKVTVESEAGPFDVVLDKDVTTVYRISGASRTEIKADDLEKGNYILVTGPEIGTEITANTIHVDEHYIAKSGKIIEVNSDSFYIKVMTLEKDNLIIDIEKATTSQIVDIKTLALESAGFSKLKEGDNVHFVAKKGQEKNQTRYSGVKLIIIPQEYFIK